MERWASGVTAENTQPVATSLIPSFDSTPLFFKCSWKSLPSSSSPILLIKAALPCKRERPTMVLQVEPPGTRIGFSRAPRNFSICGQSTMFMPPFWTPCAAIHSSLTLAKISTRAAPIPRTFFIRILRDGDATCHPLSIKIHVPIHSRTGCHCVPPS